MHDTYEPQTLDMSELVDTSDEFPLRVWLAYLAELLAMPQPDPWFLSETTFADEVAALSPGNRNVRVLGDAKRARLLVHPSIVAGAAQRDPKAIGHYLYEALAAFADDAPALLRQGANDLLVAHAARHFGLEGIYARVFYDAQSVVTGLVAALRAHFATHREPTLRRVHRELEWVLLIRQRPDRFALALLDLVRSSAFGSLWRDELRADAKLATVADEPDRELLALFGAKDADLRRRLTAATCAASHRFTSAPLNS